MKSLNERIADRRKREEDRLSSGQAQDQKPSNHAAEALDPETNAPLGDGLGQLASTGANGALGAPVDPADVKPATSWPEVKQPEAAKTDAAKGAAPKKDPNA